jgi:hypothetical protein
MNLFYHAVQNMAFIAPTILSPCVAYGATIILATRMHVYSPSDKTPLRLFSPNTYRHDRWTLLPNLQLLFVSARIERTVFI